MDAAVVLFAYKIFILLALVGVAYFAFMALLWGICKPLGLCQSGETFWQYMSEL